VNREEESKKIVGRSQAKPSI